MEEKIKVDFLHVLAVRVAEWIKKVNLSKWEKEWAGMNEIQHERYDFVLSNYDGLFKKK